MVVTFVGFLGGWTKAAADSVGQFEGGILGALTATWFTFLPSFLFILLGGPLIEATMGDIKWSAPLTAITAAVALIVFKRGSVEVILAAALIGLGVQTLFP